MLFNFSFSAFAKKGQCQGGDGGFGDVDGVTVQHND
jgi:hypothetical protein